MTAPPPASRLSVLFPPAWLQDHDCVTGWNGSRESFRRVVEGGDENVDRAYVVEFRRPTGGVFLNADLPDCRPYRTRPGSLELPRDHCAAALADAVREGCDPLDSPVMLSSGWVVVAASDDSENDGESCIARAAAIADRLEARMPELLNRTGTTPSPPDTGNSGLAAAVDPGWWWPMPQLRDEREDYVVPIQRGDLFPGAEAVRVHTRERLGPETSTLLCVGWQAPPNASAYWAQQSTTSPYRLSHGCTGLPHSLLGDREVVLRRLVGALGSQSDDVELVSSAGAFNGKHYRAIDSAQDMASTWTIVAGKEAASDAEDSRLVEAARRLAEAGPHVFDSAGRWFLLGHDVGIGLLTPQLLAHGTARAGDRTTHVEAEIELGPGGRTSDFRSLAWSTRALRGGELLVEVSPIAPHVTVISGNDRAFAERLLPVLEPRHAQLAPSRWIVTPDLVVAVGTRRLQRGWRHNSSSGPSHSDLGSVFRQIDDAAPGASSRAP